MQQDHDVYSNGSSNEPSLPGCQLVVCPPVFERLDPLTSDADTMASMTLNMTVLFIEPRSMFCNTVFLDGVAI